MPNPTPKTPDLDAIAARLAAATPGPWHVNHGDDRLCMNTFYVATTKTDDDPCEVYEDVVCVTLYQAERCASHRAYRWEEDAEFIAAAPADIAALLVEVERLREALRQIESEEYDFAAMYPAYAELMDKIKATEDEAKECADCEREREWYPGEVFMGKRYYGGCEKHRHLLNHLRESSERFYDRLHTLAPKDVARKALEGIPK
ncbi:hypothetical protein LJC46_10065 [Desulfovibrio sp. OttesenSCG-928-G15]|nr:hypothetical protein [Desulfovibrio sp. OttesenSCG-928-G15]